MLITTDDVLLLIARPDSLTLTLTLSLSDSLALRATRYALRSFARSLVRQARISALKKTFGKWHGISSLLNLVNLICAVGHAFYLGGLAVGGF